MVALIQYSYLAGDRAHVIEKRHDTKSGNLEQHQELINLDESKHFLIICSTAVISLDCLCIVLQPM